MKSGYIAQTLNFSNGGLVDRLTGCRTGRIALHTLSFLRRPDHLRWHWRGILRELEPAVAVTFLAEPSSCVEHHSSP